MARGLKLRILEVERLYYYSENKGADQLYNLYNTPQLICGFVFSYAKGRFSHDMPNSDIFSPKTGLSFDLVKLHICISFQSGVPEVWGAYSHAE